MKTTRNLWPLGIIGAFIIFFCGITTVIVIASTHRESLVNANYYEQELKFQNQIDSSDRAQKSGASIIFDASSHLVAITLPTAHLTQKLSGTVELYRPADAKLDREFPLEPRADGTQTLNVSNFASGLWLARVKWTAAGSSYFLEQKITVAGR